LVQEVNKPSPHLVTVWEVKGYGFSDFTISSAVPEILRSPKIWKVGHLTRATPLSGHFFIFKL